MSASPKNIMLAVVLAMIVFCSIAVDAAPTHGTAGNGLLLVNIAVNNILSSCAINQDTRNTYYPYYRRG